MKSLALFPMIVAAACLLATCAHSDFEAVGDQEVRKQIEADWIRNDSFQLTSYYPDAQSLERVEAAVEQKGIKERDVSEILYYSLEGGRHVMFVETDEANGSARYHCFGLTSDRQIVVYWVQFQQLGKDMRIERIEKRKMPNKPQQDKPR